MTSRPDSEWVPSPNFHVGRADRADKPISCIVIHATETSGVQSPKNWLCNPISKVSAHYLIDTDGKIYHLVHESNTAWHAGASEWAGKENVNDFSVGIELVNLNDGLMPYPDAQLKSCAALIKPMMLDYGIVSQDVVGHLDIAPSRKNDPAGFPWDKLSALL